MTSILWKVDNYRELIDTRICPQDYRLKVIDNQNNKDVVMFFVKEAMKAHRTKADTFILASERNDAYDNLLFIVGDHRSVGSGEVIATAMGGNLCGIYRNKHIIESPKAWIDAHILFTEADNG